MAKKIKKPAKKTIAKKVAVKKTNVKKGAVKKVVAKKIVSKGKKAVKTAKKAVKPMKRSSSIVKSNKQSKNKLSSKDVVVRKIKDEPEETALTKAEVAEYKDKLIALKDEILNQIREISEDTLMKSQTDATGENSAYTLDAASENYDREFNFRLVSGDRELILEIDSALKKIEGGDYGICVVCDKIISKNRLSVIPYAKHCRKCKEQLEKEEQV